ncbi:Hypothetical predicted protein [Olea europaea subsp. europaea]|uniref:Uncharacterized protein n=1 Tax=Olea europaea subsp. europaea TaxID=158383 RepID=A0A8S0TDR5_OLEEU|nr:Hypothetical predicted protein [Olea europaea subsp. europaea]
MMNKRQATTGGGEKCSNAVEEAVVAVLERSGVLWCFDCAMTEWCSWTKVEGGAVEIWIMVYDNGCGYHNGGFGDVVVAHDRKFGIGGDGGGYRSDVAVAGGVAMSMEFVW